MHRQIETAHAIRHRHRHADRPHRARRQADRSRQGTPSRRPSLSAPIHHHTVKVERQHTQTGRAPSVTTTGTHTSPLPPCPAPPARRQAAPCTPTGRQIAAGHAVPPSVPPCADSSAHREGRTPARRASIQGTPSAIATATPTGRTVRADRPTDRSRARRPAIRHALRRFITTP